MQFPFFNEDTFGRLKNKWLLFGLIFWIGHLLTKIEWPSLLKVQKKAN